MCDNSKVWTAVSVPTRRHEQLVAAFGWSGNLHPDIATMSQGFSVSSVGGEPSQLAACAWSSFCFLFKRDC